MWLAHGCNHQTPSAQLGSGMEKAARQLDSGRGTEGSLELHLCAVLPPAGQALPASEGEAGAERSPSLASLGLLFPPVSWAQILGWLAR